MKFIYWQLTFLTMCVSILVSCNSVSKKSSTSNNHLDSISLPEIEIPKYKINNFPEQGFSAGFPGKPEIETSENGITVYKYIKETDVFVIGVSKTGDKKFSKDAAIKILSSVVQNPDTISFGEVILPNNIKGIELTLLGKVSGLLAYYSARIFVHKGKVYQLSVITDGEDPPIEKVTAFWDAFSLK